MKLKTILTGVFLVIFLLNASAQETEEATLFGDDLKLTGWFVELPFTHAQVIEKNIFMTGISGGVIFNDVVRVGLAGRSFSNKFNRIAIAGVDDGNGGYLRGSEGGLFIEPVIGNNKLVHLTIPIMIGAGYAEVKTKAKYPDEDNEMDHLDIDDQVYFLFKPSVQIEVNLHKNIRFGAGVGYRFTSDNQLEGVDNDLSGFSSNVSLKIGKF